MPDTNYVVPLDANKQPVYPNPDDDSVVYINGTRYVVKRAAVALAATGDAVAAVATKKIRLIFCWLSANGAVNVKWRSNATDLTGLWYVDAAGRGKVLPPNPYGWAETAAGEALNLFLSGAIAVGGVVGYIEL